MSKVHRRVLSIKDARCHPIPGCPLQASCARYTSPLPQGFGAALGNFRKFVVNGTGGTHSCQHHMSVMLPEAEKADIDAAAAKRAVRPAISSR